MSCISKTAIAEEMATVTVLSMISIFVFRS